MFLGFWKKEPGLANGLTPRKEVTTTVTMPERTKPASLVGPSIIKTQSICIALCKHFGLINTTEENEGI